jgi:hypothetical protein
MPEGSTRHECCNCGVVFWITDYMQSCRLKDAQSFYCPNGHPQSYGKTEADKVREAKALVEKERDALRRQRDQLKQNEAWFEDRLKAGENQRRALKGQITKITKRVASGVCPCCNRSFVNLKRHMAGKHPAFAAEPTP